VPLGPLDVDGAERGDAVSDQARERLVLPLDLDAAEVHPGSEHDDVDARSILLLEDPSDVAELTQRRADLASAVAHDLSTLVPRDLRAQPRHDHVRVHVHDHSARSPRSE